MDLKDGAGASQRYRRRLDLAVIIPTLNKYGGAERYLIECVQCWQDRHDITLYSSQFDRALLAEHGVGSDIKCVELSPYFEGEHGLLLNATLLPKMWQQEIGSHDLYHTHLWPTHLIDLHPMVWFPHEPLRMLTDLRFELNAVPDKMAHSVHVYPKFTYDALGQSRFAAVSNAIAAMDRTARPERIVANSRYTAQCLEEVYGRAIDDVVYPGVQPGPSPDLPVDPNLFVTVTQLWSHKRVGLLIEAIALVDEAQLIVVGSGPELEHLEQLTDRLGVSDRVFFLSALNNQELQLVLARASAFLYASINEPFGIAVLEAKAAGKPLIAVNQGGYVEVCSPDCSFLVPPYPSVFAQRIGELQSNPALVRRMGQAAKEAVANYTWQRTAAQLETLLLETWSLSHASSGQVASEPAQRPLVGIQYYAWYGDGFGTQHWNDSRESGYVSDKPMLGYYSSSKGQTIEYHLDLFESMSLDFVIINLHLDSERLNGQELISIGHLFEIAVRRGAKLRFAIELAPYTMDADKVAGAIQLIQTSFMGKPNYLRLDGAPVLFWFWTGAADGNKPLLEQLIAATAGMCNIALSPRLPRGAQEAGLSGGLFRGFAPFSPLELAGEEHWNRVWMQAYRDAGAAGMTHRIATVSPGYDDRDLSDERRFGNRYRFVPRRDGETYRHMIDFVVDLKPRPNLVIVSTFNEYHENSHIEPSLNNGDRYIDMTRQLVERLNSQQGAA